MNVRCALVLACNMALLTACHARDLEAGMQGDDVRQWQAFLIRHRFLAGRPTGKFNNGTRQATVNFQARYNLPQTGVVSEATLRWSKAAIAARTLPRPAPTPIATPAPAPVPLPTPVAEQKRAFNFSIPSPYHGNFARIIYAFSARIKETSDEEELRQIISTANGRHDAIVLELRQLKYRSPKLIYAAASLEYLAQGAETKIASRKRPQLKYSFGSLLDQAMSRATDSQNARN